jgi:hypothetical protein
VGFGIINDIHHEWERAKRMKLELTTGVALSVGLVILFGAGYGAVDSVVESGATRQLEETVAAESRAVAVEGVLRWERLLDRYRGIVKAGLQNPVVNAARWVDADADVQGLENVLATLLSRANGRGQAAVISSDSTVISSTVSRAGSESLSWTKFRAVQDALNGTPIVRSEKENGNIHVVAAAPIESGDALIGVLVVTAPVDRRELAYWELLSHVTESALILSDSTGDTIANNLREASEKRVSRITEPGQVNIDGSSYWASRAVLNDDGGLAGHIVGLKVISREPVQDMIVKIRKMFQFFGAVALLMTLMVAMFVPAPAPVVQTVSVPEASSRVSMDASASAAKRPASPAVDSVSGDLPPLRLGSEGRPSGSNDDGGSSNLGLAAQLAAAATRDSSSSARPTPVRNNDMASKAVSEVPTPEHAGDVTFGKGASPRPDAVEEMMGSMPGRAKSTPNLPMPPTPPAASPPEPPPRPVTAEPGPFGVQAIDESESSDDSEPSGHAIDLTPPPPSVQEWTDGAAQATPFGTAPFADNIVGDGSGASDLGFTPGFGGDDQGFSIPVSEPPPAFDQGTEPSNFGEHSATPPPALPPMSAPAPAFGLGDLPSVPAFVDDDPPETAEAQEANSAPFESGEASEDSEQSSPMNFTAAFPKPFDEVPGDGKASAEAVPQPEEAANLAISLGSIPPPPPPSDALGGLGHVGDGAATLMTHGAPPSPPPPPVMADGGGDHEATSQMSAPPPPTNEEMTAYSEGHYRSVYDRFVGSKRDLGENVDAILFDGFSAKLRKSEEALISQHGCKAVRFEVLVKGAKVSLRPQLVR